MAILNLIERKRRQLQAIDVIQCGRWKFQSAAVNTIRSKAGAGQDAPCLRRRLSAMLHPCSRTTRSVWLPAPLSSGYDFAAQPSESLQRSQA